MLEFQKDTVKLTLPVETIDHITVANLRDTYEGLHRQTSELRKKINLQDYEEQDLAYDVLVMDAIARVLRYFCTQEEHEKWLKSVSKNSG